ncbi:MAG: YaaA family protein, partial [Angustibacter sp.]
MHILLPPSEGKTAPASGRRPVQLAGLGWPELAGARSEVLAQLTKVSAHPDALALLKVGPSLAAEVRGNQGLLSAPTAPASAVYTGVLYDELDFAGLSLRARRRAQATVVIFSALWGILRPADRIPQYRLGMTAKIPELGGLAAFWRAHLAGALAPLAGGLLVDCRSASYQAAWLPTGPGVEHVQVNVFRESGGRRTV